MGKNVGTPLARGVADGQPRRLWHTGLAETLQTPSWASDSGVHGAPVRHAFLTQHSRGVSVAYSQVGTAKPVLTQQTQPAFLSGAARLPQATVARWKTVQIKSDLCKPVQTCCILSAGGAFAKLT